jgi:hypothetical protein
MQHGMIDYQMIMLQASRPDTRADGARAME